MKISIAGKNIDIGASFQEYAEERLKKSASKYLTNVTWAEVCISKHSHTFHTNITLHEDKKITVKADADSDEVYNAFDSSLIKIEKQLRKYKDKLLTKKKHEKDTKIDDIIKGTKYVISSKQEEIAEEHVPLTIAEKVTDVETLTVSEAIMKMDLYSLPALLFKNIANGRLNVVYHRVDGNISWVDPGSDLS